MFEKKNMNNGYIIDFLLFLWNNSYKEILKIDISILN